ncbi:MAG: carboxypeptidase-like regulatory domain-containing protein, partial [Paludibacter sp.]
MKEAKKQKRLLFKRSVLSFLAVLFTFSTVSAQIKSVSGVVKDQSGETIIGASVLVKGTTIGTVTGMDGDYKLSIPANGKVLVISYVGMEKQEIPITSSVINVTLKSNALNLDEVVVVGYGTQKKRDL